MNFFNKIEWLKIYYKKSFLKKNVFRNDLNVLSIIFKIALYSFNAVTIAALYYN